MNPDNRFYIVSALNANPEEIQTLQEEFPLLLKDQNLIVTTNCPLDLTVIKWEEGFRRIYACPTASIKETLNFHQELAAVLKTDQNFIVTPLYVEVSTFPV